MEEGILFVCFEFVGAKKLETAKSLVTGQTLFATLGELEDVVDDDGFLIVLFCLELDLQNDE